MPSRILLFLLAALILAPASAHAATIAQPGAPTEVREHAGTIVFSQYDAATKQYTLMTRAPGGAPTAVPGVAPADRTFDADIGPRRNGGSQLVYVRCEDTCDLFTYALPGGGQVPTGERRIVRASDPDHDDLTPTIWNGRIAWARVYGEQIDRKVVVYTRSLDGPSPSRVAASTRLPGVPVRRCGDVNRTCGATNGRTVLALELYGKNLAQVVSYGCRGCSGTSQSELRLVDARTRAARQVMFQVVGLSGQSLVGPSFHAGTLGWYRACLGDPAGCQGGTATPYRYAVTSGRGSRAPGGPVRVDGFADTGSTLYEVAGCNFETSGDFNRDCRIDEAAAPAYARVTLPRR